MKRIVSLLLALLMLTGCAALFSSCGEEVDGVVTLSRSTVELELSDYVLLYGESQGEGAYTQTFQAQLELFAEALGQKTGKKFNARTAARSNAQAKEILIGATDREESKKALAGIAGDGFAINVSGEKVVIVGTDNLFTLMGMQYFVERYLGGDQVSALELNESANASNVGRVLLGDEANKTDEAAKNAYTFVYKDGLGTLPAAFAATGSVTAQMESAINVSSI